MKWIASLITLTLLAIFARGQARKIEIIPNTHADNEQAYLDLLAKDLGDNPHHKVFLSDTEKSDFAARWFSQTRVWLLRLSGKHARHRT